MVPGAQGRGVGEGREWWSLDGLDGERNPPRVTVRIKQRKNFEVLVHSSHTAGV